MKGNATVQIVLI